MKLSDMAKTLREPAFAARFKTCTTVYDRGDVVVVRGEAQNGYVFYHASPFWSDIAMLDSDRTKFSIGSGAQCEDATPAVVALAMKHIMEDVMVIAPIPI